MASVSESRFSGLMRELFSADMYKRSQGRRVRQLTVTGLGLFLAWGLYSLSVQLVSAKPADWESGRWIWVAYGVPVLIGVVFSWGLFRIYNWPRFADFLIATEAEMGKVSWSTRSELQRATIVIVLTLFLMSGFLLSVDFVWSWVLEHIGVLQPRSKVIEKAALDSSALTEVVDFFTRV